MTATTALSILSGLLSIVKMWTEFMARKQWIDAGYQQAVNKGLQDANAAIETARKARAEARATATTDPDSIMRPDSERRKD